MKVEIRKPAVSGVIQDLISEFAAKNPKNLPLIAELLVEGLTESNLEALLNLMMMRDAYKKLSIDDYCVVTPPSYHQGEKFEFDILKDMGLLAKDNKVYCKIIGDTSWSNNLFNPFHSLIKVDLLYHDKNKKLIKCDHSFNPFDLKKVSKKSIAYFKNLEECPS